MLCYAMLGNATELSCCFVVLFKRRPAPLLLVQHTQKKTVFENSYWNPQYRRASCQVATSFGRSPFLLPSGRKWYYAQTTENKRAISKPAVVSEWVRVNEWKRNKQQQATPSLLPKTRLTATWTLLVPVGWQRRLCFWKTRTDPTTTTTTAIAER